MNRYRSNFYVLTTCSPRNFDMVKSYGADYVVDYNSPTAITDLLTQAKENESTMGPLTLCLDCVSKEDTARFCEKVLNPNQEEDNSAGRTYSAILPFTPPLKGITSVTTLGYSFLGEEWEQFGKMNPASPEDFESSKKFAILAESLLAHGKIRAHPLDVRKGGLETVATEGLDDIRKGVSGKKIVYPL